jgi:hypothetical protein
MKIKDFNDDNKETASENQTHLPDDFPDTRRGISECGKGASGWRFQRLG